MLKYIMLGIVQGLTEFLPVSSSGHLLIVQKIFGIQGQEVALSVVLHLGTICALILFFFKYILEAITNIRLLLFIIVVTIITGVIGIIGKDFFEGLFTSVKLVSLALIVTGSILILTRRFMHAKRDILDIGDALILGFAQAVAIMPGISRSGITISALLFRKIDRDTSFKFSFLASIPAILGATLLEAKKINFAFQANLTNFSAGFIFSFISGLFSLWILKRILKKAKFYYFGYYCIFIAILTLLFIK